jgi:membrane-bound ClpP family serine protease
MVYYWSLLQEFARARSRKRRPRLPAVSSTAIVNTDLNPQGSVLANGELWQAQTVRGNSIPHQTTVTIVGFQDHLLLVTERA